MAMTWGDYRTMVRRSILKDPDKKTWTDDNLLDFLSAAVRLFCSHTAAATSASFTGDGTVMIFTLPDHLYEAVDQSGSVFIDDGTCKHLLEPVNFPSIPNVQEHDYNYLPFPDRSVTLFAPLLTNQTLVIYYYAVPTLPILDADLMPIPAWAYSAIAYMIAVYALSGPSVRQANIRQWGSKPDTGDPEDNSYSKPMQWFIDQYELELAKHIRQNRTAFKRTR